MSNADRKAYRFTQRLRVRWAEVDLQGIVFNAHYLMYIDTAIADYWRALAMPYPQALTHFGGDLFVRKATCEYHASAGYDDQIEVGIRCARIGNSSIQFDAAIFRAEELLLTAELVYVYADPAAKKSMSVPQEFRQILESYEAGRPMVQVRVGSWDELGAVAQPIRHEVFIAEQKIPADLEWDGADETCVHAVAFNLYGLPLATGRLLEHVPGVAKIGRMAVRREMRGSHTGRAVLEALMAAARARGDHEAVLHAQVSAEGFYARCGFVPRGPRFDEAGIEHVEMVRALR
jgi:YbgC/YbaW family acyl-CoA thioester hydrolase